MAYNYIYYVKDLSKEKRSLMDKYSKALKWIKPKNKSDRNYKTGQANIRNGLNSQLFVLYCKIKATRVVCTLISKCFSIDNISVIHPGNLFMKQH